MSTRKPNSVPSSRRTHNSPRIGILIVAGLCFAFPTPWSPTIEAQDVCARCKAWEREGEMVHYATYNFPVLEGWHGNEDEEDADPDGGHNKLLEGTCEPNHLTCVGGDLLLTNATEETIDAVARRDIGLLAQLMTSSRVYLVPERSAVQILGCGSTIAVHLPINRRLLSALETVVAEQDLF